MKMNRRISHNPQLIRTLIIGNSGSGKSWLAQRLSGQLQVPWVDLDSMHWLCDEHSIARPRAESLGMARIAADEERLIKSIGNLRAGKTKVRQLIEE
jgi:shikimate kinase